jgi:hypothetical protein
MLNDEAALSELIVRIQPTGRPDSDEYRVDASFNNGLFVEMSEVKLKPEELSHPGRRLSGKYVQ